MSPLVKKGAIQFITEDDLPPLKPTDESVNLGDDLKQALKNQYVYLSLLETISPNVCVQSAVESPSHRLWWSLRHGSWFKNRPRSSRLSSTPTSSLAFELYFAVPRYSVSIR